MNPEKVAAAIPPGAEVAPEWLETVRSYVNGEPLRSDWRGRLLDVADCIWTARTPSKGVSMPGVRRIADLLGTVSLRTVQRAIHWMKDHLLLATVARGRSADWTKYGQNDREVFALIRPVEASVAPSSNQDERRSPIRRCMDFIRKAQGASPYAPMPRSERDLALWHGHKSTDGLEDELKATNEFMRRLRPYAFKDTTARALHGVLAPFLRAGVTVRRLMDMIDRRPDGSSWPHDGASGVRNYVAWARTRLAVWTASKGL